MVFALAAMVIVGIISLAVDYGFLVDQHRNLQAFVDEAAIAGDKERLAPKLAAGGVLLGAFDGDRLVGVAVLGGEFLGTRANQLGLAFLYVRLYGVNVEVLQLEGGRHTCLPAIGRS